MELKELQELVKRTKSELDNKGKLTWPAMALLADLVEEVGELAESVKSAEGFKPYKKMPRGNISREVSDILFSLATIANHYGVDMEAEFLKTLDGYKNRFLK